jgi:hypothetical protein
MARRAVAAEGNAVRADGRPGLQATLFTPAFTLASAYQPESKIPSRWRGLA